MTVEEYKRWQAGEKPNLFGKLGLIIKFWKTEPTYEQEDIRSKLMMYEFSLGIILGITAGFFFGIIVGVSI